MPVSLLRLLPCELLDEASRVWEGRRLLQGGSVVRRRLPWSLVVLWPVGMASRPPHRTLALRAAGRIHLCILLQWLNLPVPRPRQVSDQGRGRASQAAVQARVEAGSLWQHGQVLAHGRQLQP